MIVVPKLDHVLERLVKGTRVRGRFPPSVVGIRVGHIAVVIGDQPRRAKLIEVVYDAYEPTIAVSTTRP